MTTIVTRTGKGSPLTHVEVDTNFTNLNTNKLEAGAIALGSAGTPSISFTGDTNTGIFSPGADQLAISTNGVARLTTSTTAVSSSLAIDHPLGAVGTPSITFTGDLNTGFYSPAADTLAAVTAGTNRLHITSGGLVGLGTSSPTNYGAGINTLSINGTAGSVADVYFNGTRQGYIGTLASNELVIDTAGAAIPLKLQANSTERARIRGDGTFEIKGAGTAGSSPAVSVSPGAPANSATLDSSGRLLVGTSSSRNLTGASFSLQIEGDGTSPYSGLSILNKANSAAPAYLILGKSRGGATGVDAVSNASGGDTIGDIWFAAADGTDLNSASARITCFVDGAVSGDDVPGRLVFSTTPGSSASPTERMRIPSSGGLLLNTTSRINDGLATIGFQGSIQKGLILNDTDPANTRQFIGFHISGTTQIGYIANNNNTGVTYNTSSDYRLKENVVPLTGAFDRLNQLQVHRFNFIAAPDHTVDGFLAHEAQAVVPECVTGEKDAVDEDGNPVYQGIDQSKLVPLLTAALQEAIAKIETLEARLTAAGIA